MIKIFLILFFYVFLFASCEKKVFNVSSSELAKSSSLIRYFAKKCEFSISFSNEITQKEFEKIKLKYPIINKNLDQVFDILLKDNDFNYEYNKTNHSLSISKISTVTFNLEYPSIIRNGNSNTVISLYDSNLDKNNQTSNKITSGVQISTNNTFDFWASISKEIESILNRPEDDFIAPKPLINKYAGLVTITGTPSQILRVKNYIKKIQNKLNKQVLLDISILNVTLNENNNTGIDWSYLQNPLNFSANIGYNKNVDSVNNGTYKTISANIDMKRILNFLHSYGDVKTISNPKIRTLNNQSAIISIGEQLYYKRKSSTTINADKVTTTQNDIIESTFSGILIDIVPTIENNNEIILKINPSISSLKYLDTATSTRDMPPDILKKQISTIVRLKNRQKIIIGGLIDTKQTKQKEYIPVLGYIPIIGSLFSYDQDIKQTNELVIIITPYIDNNETYR